MGLVCSISTVMRNKQGILLHQWDFVKVSWYVTLTSVREGHVTGQGLCGPYRVGDLLVRWPSDHGWCGSGRSRYPTTNYSLYILVNSSFYQVCCAFEWLLTEFVQFFLKVISIENMLALYYVILYLLFPIGHNGPVQND